MARRDVSKVAVVTGATRGIGKHVALQLLRRGYFVIGNYGADDEGAERARGELAAVSPDVVIVKADMSSFEGMAVLLERVAALSSGVDCLVFNAGFTNRSPLAELTPEAWDYVLRGNLSVPFFFLQRLEPSLRNGGRIVFVGSVLGRMPHAVSIPYGVSKAALEALAKYLAVALAPRQITVNVVAPGFVDTGWHAGKDEAQRQRIAAKTSLKRFGTPEEIAGACLHLVDNGYLTGQTLVVDGGYSLGTP